MNEQERSSAGSDRCRLRGHRQHPQCRPANGLQHQHGAACPARAGRAAQPSERSTKTRPSKLDAFATLNPGPRPSRSSSRRCSSSRSCARSDSKAATRWSRSTCVAFAPGPRCASPRAWSIRPAKRVRSTGRPTRYTGPLGGERCVVHAFSLVLPFSRYLVVRFALDEKPAPSSPFTRRPSAFWGLSPA